MEQENSQIQSVVIEGGDHLGKGTVCENVTNHLSELGVETLPLSFPNYGTPVGASIRRFLATGYFEKETDLNPYEIMKTKRALYALNRLEVLNTLLANPEHKEKVLIWDRSAYSNALTIGYYLFDQGVEIEDSVEEGVRTAFEMESFLREKFNTDNCVVRLTRSGSKWEIQRGEKGDINESSEVQDISDGVYDIYREKVGEGWTDVVTRENNKWRSHEEILSDVMDHVKKRIDIPVVDTPSNIDRLSNKEVLSTLYGIVEDIPFVEDFDTAVRSNDKEGFYKYGMKVAEFVVTNMKGIHWYNEEIKEAVRKLFQMTPRLEESLNDLWDGEFGTKLVVSLMNE